MEWARVFDQEALFIKINFEKAYEMIEWNFILSMLQALGFDLIFIQSVRMLFRDCYDVLTMNCVYSTPITVAHFVHQSFPLITSLFILAVELLVIF